MRKSLEIKRKPSSPSEKIDKKIELFLSNYSQLIINMKKNDKIFSNYFSTQEKYYFSSNPICYRTVNPMKRQIFLLLLYLLLQSKQNINIKY